MKIAGRETGRIGLGCMGMTWAYGAAERDEAESIATIHRAIELAVTLLDTADMYGPYTNEELVGRAIAGRRDEVVLATKCGLVVEDEAEYVLRKDGRPEHVRSAIEGSLRRLQTDFVDLYQLHRVDPEVPLEETWGAMAELVAAGKVGAIGLSEVSVDELERAHAIHPVASVQSEGSLWTRDAFASVVPWCAEHGAAFLPFAPLGRGFLTGQLASQKFPPGDFRKNNPRFQPDAMDANLALVEVVRAVAARHDATPAQVALAWLLAQGDHVIPIPGTKRRTRLEENAAAATLTLTAEDLAELDALPAPVGDRY
ncbi:aldo/keto reductase [Solirubrobacter soli]|uniref:aldo/keto reductase n=1 Tax=Solirubrobacter soli TaxID=363832 RepID=UPI00041D3C11|nr:aldo/keto reductase [Solirubrobacter soli]